MRYTELNDWLKWQESLHSAEIDLGLERVREVAARLQLLSPKAKVVSVAGTNGKGSCVATLEALCLQQGLSVGSFTSPHLLRYNERIKVNGEEASDQLICEAFERIDQARGEISLTYFEFGTLAAIDIFTRQGVAVMVLEVGLGGRLDAVNIMDADVAVVTSIALDHQDWLGTDLHQIGYEKAGIYRPHRWAICADEAAPESVADYAHSIQAYWVAMGMSLNIGTRDTDWSWQGVTDEGELLQLGNLPRPQLPLPSVAAALQAFVLLGYDLPEDMSAVVAGLQLVGRAQNIEHNGRHFLLDVAHNPAAAELLAQRLLAEPCSGKTHCVIAMMRDKDRAGVFAALAPVVSAWYVADLPGNPRAATATMLQTDLQALNGSVQTCDNVAQAIQQAAAAAADADRIVIMGSFFTVAEALSHLGDGA